MDYHVRKSKVKPNTIINWIDMNTTNLIIVSNSTISIHLFLSKFVNAK